MSSRNNNSTAIGSSDEMLDAFKTIAKAAGELIEKNRRTQHVEEKADSSLLTETDLLVNEFILKELSKRYPNISILSEESTPPTKASRFFAVDPIDGTREFVDSMKNPEVSPSYSVMIGLVEDEHPVCGVVYFPAKGKLYSAAKGKGSFLEEGGVERRIRVHPSDRIVVSRFHVDEELRYVLKERYGKTLSDVFRVGSFGAKVCLVADGTYGAFIHTNYDLKKVHACLWDSCAPDIILEEAGGRSSELKTGAPIIYRLDRIPLSNGYIAEARG